MFRRTAALVLASLMVTSVLAAASNSGTARGVVLGMSDIPTPSGLVSTWVEISIRSDGGKNPIKMFIPYIAVNQRLPHIGSSCAFNYHIGDVGGAVGHVIKKIRDAQIVDDFACHE